MDTTITTLSEQLQYTLEIVEIGKIDTSNTQIQCINIIQ